MAASVFESTVLMHKPKVASHKHDSIELKNRSIKRDQWNKKELKEYLIQKFFENSRLSDDKYIV